MGKTNGIYSSITDQQFSYFISWNLIKMSCFRDVFVRCAHIIYNQDSMSKKMHYLKPETEFVLLIPTSWMEGRFN